MHEHITRAIDRELNRGNELADAVWHHNSRLLDTGSAGGNPSIIERIRAARRIADVVVGKLITSTDQDLASEIYLALTMSPFKASRRPGVNEDKHLKLAAEKVVAGLRQSGWRIFRNPPNYQGHGHGSLWGPPQRCENCDD